MNLGLQAVRSIVVLLAACFFSASGAEYFSELTRAGMSRIMVRATSQVGLERLSLYCSSCSRLVDEVLGLGTQPRTRIVVEEEIPGETSQYANDTTGLFVVFRNDESEVEFANRLFEALIRRRISERNGNDPCKPANLLRLVAAGVTYRYVRGRHAVSGFYEPDYEIARGQFMLRQFPDVKLLIETDFSQDQVFMYELYMMHADLLVQVLEQSGRQHGLLLLELLIAEQRGKDVIAKWTEWTSKVRKPRETIQQYYARVVLKLAMRRRLHSGNDIIQERLEALSTLPVIGMDGNSAVKRIPLEEIPEAFKDYRQDPNGLRRLAYQYQELARSAPYFLRASLQHHAMAAYQLADTGDGDAFRKSLAEARQEFKDAQEKQRQLDDMMDHFEVEHIPLLARFYDYIRIYRYYREQAEKIGPISSIDN